jgi:zinc protease
MRLQPIAFAVALLSATAAWPSLTLAAPKTAASRVATTLTEVRQVEGIQELRLSNGLQVLLIADDAKPTVTVNMTYHVGSRHENYGETGMAHLLEHLLFKGTPRNPNVFGEFNRRGLRANGSTWLDRTNYYASFAANDENLRWYLAWQADAMVHSFIARRDLDTEMTVVRNEMERGENDPQSVLFGKTLAAMYQWHNYGKDTIGARSDVEQVDIGRLQAFYRAWYQPDNATLIISGKFDPAQVRRWVVAEFGGIPAPKRVKPALYTLDPVQDGERSVTLRRVGGTPMLYAGYHVPPGAHRDTAAVELLGLILGDTPGGRLHKQLVEGRQASSVFAWNAALADPGFIIFGVQPAPSASVESVRDGLLKALETLADQPITAEELERARQRWLKDWDQVFSDPERVGVALSEAVAQGDWRVFFLTRDRVRSVTLAEVQRVAAERLLASNRTLAQYLPTDKPQRAPAPQRVDVAVELKDFRPGADVARGEVFVPDPKLIEQRLQRDRLPVGLKLALLPKSTRGQSVMAELHLHLGDAESLKGQRTTAQVLAALLDRGTSTLSRQQVSDRLDALQTELSISNSGGDDLVVRLHSRRDHLPAALSLVGELLRDPALKPEALEELRNAQLSELQSQRQEPEALTENTLLRHGNPYPRGDLRHARSFDEIEADLRAVDIAGLRSFHRRFVSAAAGELAVVGDFDVAAVRAAADQAFGRLTAPQAFRRIESPRVAATPLRQVLNTPDKQSATIGVRLALPLSDRDADYPALLMANWMLGGPAGGSRLWNRIRESEGLSYDVRAMIRWNPLDANSIWTATAIFAPQNAAKVEQALREEIDRALKEGFTAAELDGARKGLLNFRQLRRAQDASLASLLVAGLYLDRPIAEEARIDAALAALTLADVNAALRKYLKPAEFVTVLAGDFTASAGAAAASGVAPR